MSDTLVRLRPSASPVASQADVPASVNDGDFERYLLVRRDVLAQELREIEQILIASGKISRLLCAPGRSR
jgi:hypothetical protein